MKKLFLILLAFGFLMACGHSGGQSETNQHGAMYKNWDHFKFSVWGYKNPTPEDIKKSKEQGWWGTEIPSEPAK